jgi:hypothetical protein
MLQPGAKEHCQKPHSNSSNNIFVASVFNCLPAAKTMIPTVPELALFPLLLPCNFKKYFLVFQFLKQLNFKL